MAALVPASVSSPFPLSKDNLGILVFRVTVGAAAADEYVDLSYWLDSLATVIGCVPLGTAPTVPVAPVRASGTITFSDVNVDTKVVTINGVIYASATAPATDGSTPRQYDVKGTAGAAAQALADAINAGNGQGAEAAAVASATTFGTGAAPHPDVYASVSGAVCTITARVPGTAGNAITLTTDETNALASAATLTGGLDAKAGVNFVLNAQGTGQAEGSTAGALGIEGPAAQAYLVSVIGVRSSRFI
jgi:phage tail sheath gpL-like